MPIHLLDDYDKISVSFLDRYPEGSTFVFAVLHLSILEYDSISNPSAYAHQIRRHRGETICWRTHATIFDFPLDPPTFAPGHSMLDLIFQDPGISIVKFSRDFFKDPLRSCRHTVNSYRQNVVTGRCLSFLSRAVVRNSKLKTLPWLIRRRKKDPGHSYPHWTIQSSKGSDSEVRSVGTVLPLECLHLALLYLPYLLHSATYSEELVALSKRWLGLAYTSIRHIFPVAAKNAAKAVKDYIHRAAIGELIKNVPSIIWRLTRI